ncbi:MAG: fumarate/nitrate reduction transcriptional regulator Fnr [gamma proteobacterium symbiont of Bathyaustriella thionipta]|nr:fumarate/nitrate reduction transcriptional regulator Fnr [gamma proteobacterium symbiont of Bathyaustriella thionipta]
MTESNRLSMDALQISCQNCSLSQLCLPVTLSVEDVNRVDELVQREKPLHKGDFIYAQGDVFKSIYIVKSGSVKSYITDADGREQMLGFYLPGDLIGLAGVEGNRQRCSAKVLETSSFCEVPFDSLEKLASRIPALQHQLFKLFGKQLCVEGEQLVQLGQKTAEQRVAWFLLDLSARFARRGLSSAEFYLSMSRHDIGNFLGLAVETTSRIFTRLQQDGIIEVNRKQIKILEHDRLKQLVES